MVGQVTVVAWPAQMGLATSLGELADAPVTWPGLGRRDPGPIRLIVVRDAEALQRMTGGRAPTWGAGVAMPGSRTIVIRTDAGDPAGTLRHELAHLALRRAVRTRMPRWFEEGYASYASGEWSRLDGLALNVSVLRGAVPELDQLDSTLRAGPAAAEASYALATSAVLDLARRHPTGSITPLLGLLQEGVPWNDAVRRSTGLNPGQFAAAWRRDVRRRYGLLTWMVAGGFWVVMAAAVMAAAWFRRRQDLPRREALDEGWELPPPEALAELDRVPPSE